MYSLDTDGTQKMYSPRIAILTLNPLTVGAAYIRVFIFYQHIKYHVLNMLKIKCEIKQEDLKRANLYFVK